MVTIAVSRAWAFSTLKQRSWMTHVLCVGTWPSRCCAPDTSSSSGGVSPLSCPVLVPPVLGGLLRLMVRVTWGSQWELPRRVRLRGSLTPLAHRTVWGFRTSLWSPRTGRGPASRSELQQMTGCRSLHRGWARFWRWWFGCAASIRKSGVARVRSRTDCYAFPGRWERRAALEASSFSRTLEAGRLVPGGAGRSPATASGSIFPGSAWGGN